MKHLHLVALAVAGVVFPAFVIVVALAALGVYVAQEVALAGIATLALVGLGGSARHAERR